MLKSKEEIDILIDSIPRSVHAPDFKSIYNGCLSVPVVKSFIHNIRLQDEQEYCNLPMGVSAWEKHGIKHGYWDYFEQECKRGMIELLKGMKQKFNKEEDVLWKDRNDIAKQRYEQAKRNGYNKAIENIIAKLK